jgi:transcriptional regulator with XRE-family HTH domain
MGKRMEIDESPKNKSQGDNDFLIRIGQRIQEIRLTKGLTQIELSYRCEMERSNMRRIEAGGTNPTILTLKKIADALEVGLAEIVKLG